MSQRGSRHWKDMNHQTGTSTSTRASRSKGSHPRRRRTIYVIFWTLALSYESEDVKAALKPVVEAVSDLRRFMLGMIGPTNRIHVVLFVRKESVTMKPTKAFGCGWKHGLAMCAFLYRLTPVS